MKNLKPLLALAVILTLLSSCKKSDPTYTDILTSHKWTVSTSVRTYDDSTGISHNLLATNATCTTEGYIEFHDYTANNPVRQSYQYITSTCPGYISPSIDISSWDIDKDNANLYLEGQISNNTTQTTGGKWYAITTLNSSTLVITYKHQEIIGYTGGSNSRPIYHTVIETITFSAK